MHLLLFFDVVCTHCIVYEQLMTTTMLSQCCNIDVISLDFIPVPSMVCVSIPFTELYERAYIPIVLVVV